MSERVIIPTTVDSQNTAWMRYVTLAYEGMFNEWISACPYYGALAVLDRSSVYALIMIQAIRAVLGISCSALSLSLDIQLIALWLV